MDFPIHIATTSMGLSIVYFKGSKFLNYDVSLSLEVVLILANSADPDEMQLYAAFIWVFTVCNSIPHLKVSSI